jgi:hypothetical protein
MNGPVQPPFAKPPAGSSCSATAPSELDASLDELTEYFVRLFLSSGRVAGLEGAGGELA